MYGSWTMYDGMLHNGTLELWQAWVRAGRFCPVCLGDKLLTWPAAEPTEPPEDRTFACPLCCENEFSE